VPAGFHRKASRATTLLRDKKRAGSE